MNELTKRHTLLNPQKIRQEIIGSSIYYGPTIWKVLLETVGLKPEHIKREDLYNDFEYKSLFKYSFVEYLANHTMKRSTQCENFDYRLIIVDKVESDLHSRSSDKDLHSRSSDKDLHSRSSDKDLYSRSGDKDLYSRSSDKDLYSRSSEDVILDLQDTYSSILRKEVSLVEVKPNEHLRLVYRHPIQINNKVLHQIHIDLKRLPMEFLKVNNVDVSYIYYNILVLVSHRRLSLGYIQGMADILVPFVVEFAKENILTAESSSYFCYLRLLDRIQNYITGLQSDLIFLLNSKLERIDPEMFSFLKETKLEIHMFAFRWFNCLFIREFPYELYKQIFITMLSYEKIGEFLVYFGVSLILKFKSELLTRTFSENIILLQTISEYEWTKEMVLGLLKTTSIYYKTLGGFGM